MLEHGERNRICLILSLFVFTLLGCVATRTDFYKLPVDGFAGYSIIEIPDFAKTDAEWVPYDSNLQIPDMIAEKLRTTDYFDEIVRAQSVSTPEGKALLVEGTVTGYDRGCKYCEWYAGFYDNGKSSVSVRVKLIDKSTGAILSDAEIFGRAKKPGFGESRYIRVVDEIVSIIEDVNGNKS